MLYCKQPSVQFYLFLLFAIYPINIQPPTIFSAKPHGRTKRAHFQRQCSAVLL